MKENTRVQREHIKGIVRSKFTFCCAHTHTHTHTKLNVLSFSTKFSYLKNKHFGDVIHFSDSTVMRGLGFSC